MLFQTTNFLQWNFISQILNTDIHDIWKTAWITTILINGKYTLLITEKWYDLKYTNNLAVTKLQKFRKRQNKHFSCHFNICKNLKLFIFIFITRKNNIQVGWLKCVIFKAFNISFRFWMVQGLYSSVWLRSLQCFRCFYKSDTFQL